MNLNERVFALIYKELDLIENKEFHLILFSLVTLRLVLTLLLYEKVQHVNEIRACP